MTALDPIDSEDLTELRREILRLRDLVLGAEAEAGVLRARIAEMEHEAHRHHDLGQAYDNLAATHEQVLQSRWWRLRDLAARPVRALTGRGT